MRVSTSKMRRCVRLAGGLLLVASAAMAEVTGVDDGNSGETIVLASFEDHHPEGKLLGTPECGSIYKPVVKGCSPRQSPGSCKRYIVDDFLSADEVEGLRGVADSGITPMPEGGPTIMDVNSGYVFSNSLSLPPLCLPVVSTDTTTSYSYVMNSKSGLVNLYDGPGPGKNPFSHDQLALYKNSVERIRAKVKSLFSLETLYLTAPTFLTRVVGNPDWQPKEMHDEYYHPHVDKENTGHYDYSGLLYLADHGTDFTGGQFSFMDSGPDGKPVSSMDHGHAVNSTVMPKKGRLIIFTAGSENLHRLTKVETGTRTVLSLWFTCDESKQFDLFLDGRAHKTYKQQEGGARGGGKRRRGRAKAKKMRTAKKETNDEL